MTVVLILSDVSQGFLAMFWSTLKVFIEFLNETLLNRSDEGRTTSRLGWNGGKNKILSSLMLWPIDSYFCSQYLLLNLNKISPNPSPCKSSCPGELPSPISDPPLTYFFFHLGKVISLSVIRINTSYRTLL